VIKSESLNSSISEFAMILTSLCNPDTGIDQAIDQVNDKIGPNNKSSKKYGQSQGHGVIQTLYGADKISADSGNSENLLWPSVLSPERPGR
jgi:hypothetical protein